MKTLAALFIALVAALTGVVRHEPAVKVVAERDANTLYADALPEPLAIDGMDEYRSLVKDPPTDPVLLERMADLRLKIAAQVADGTDIDALVDEEGWPPWSTEVGQPPTCGAGTASRRRSAALPAPS
jgi:hypothetical protein